MHAFHSRLKPKKHGCDIGYGYNMPRIWEYNKF